MSCSLHRRAKCSIHDHRAGSSLARIANGEFLRNIDFKVEPITPGSASGKTWLGQTSPQLPVEVPSPNRPRSITVTDQPALFRK